MHRIYLAFLCFFRVLFGKPVPPEVLPAPAEAPALPPPAEEKTAAAGAAPAEPAPPRKAAPRAAPDGSAGALLLLSMFQREGRLIDFLRESIDDYDDATIGVAVRDIHRGLRKVLEEHFTVEPVMPGDENDAVTVADGFDPARIRLVGNVGGQPPFKGVLRHHGWRAARVKLPEVTAAVDPTVVAPAEVELS
jgi:hypothetical protein